MTNEKQIEALKQMQQEMLQSLDSNFNVQSKKWEETEKIVKIIIEGIENSILNGSTLYRSSNGSFEIENSNCLSIDCGVVLKVIKVLKKQCNKNDDNQGINIKLSKHSPNSNITVYYSTPNLEFDTPEETFFPINPKIIQEMKKRLFNDDGTRKDFETQESERYIRYLINSLTEKVKNNNCAEKYDCLNTIKLTIKLENYYNRERGTDILTDFDRIAKGIIDFFDNEEIKKYCSFEYKKTDKDEYTFYLSSCPPKIKPRIKCKQTPSDSLPSEK